MATFVPVVYAVLSQVESANLNAIQAEIVLLTGPKDFSVSVREFTTLVGAPAWSTANGLVLPAGAEVEIRLPTYEGRILAGIKIRHVDTGAGIVSGSIFKRESLAAGAVLTETALSVFPTALPNTATWITDPVATLVDETADIDTEWYVRISAATATCQVHRLLATMTDH